MTSAISTSSRQHIGFFFSSPSICLRMRIPLPKTKTNKSGTHALLACKKKINRGREKKNAEKEEKIEDEEKKEGEGRKIERGILEGKSSGNLITFFVPLSRSYSILFALPSFHSYLPTFHSFLFFYSLFLSSLPPFLFFPPLLDPVAPNSLLCYSKHSILLYLPTSFCILLTLLSFSPSLSRSCS